jgi:hypothetical protein
MLISNNVLYDICTGTLSLQREKNDPILIPIWLSNIKCWHVVVSGLWAGLKEVELILI